MRDECVHECDVMNTKEARKTKRVSQFVWWLYEITNKSYMYILGEIKLYHVREGNRLLFLCTVSHHTTTTNNKLHEDANLSNPSHMTGRNIVYKCIKVGCILSSVLWKPGYKPHLRVKGKLFNPWTCTVGMLQCKNPTEGGGWLDRILLLLSSCLLVYHLAFTWYIDVHMYINSSNQEPTVCTV
jgi:hypothetical protein